MAEVERRVGSGQQGGWVRPPLQVFTPDQTLVREYDEKRQLGQTADVVANGLRTPGNDDIDRNVDRVVVVVRQRFRVGRRSRGSFRLVAVVVMMVMAAGAMVIVSGGGWVGVEMRIEVVSGGVAVLVGVAEGR